MAEHRIAILNRIAVADAGIELVCNNPTDTIRFEFDEEWSRITAKTARFSWDGKYIDVPFSGNVVVVPEIFQTNYVNVGVFADNIASTPAKVKCRYSIKCLGGKVAPPSQDIYAEIIALINSSIELNKSDVSNIEADLAAFEKNRPFNLTGNPVQVETFEGMPLNPVTIFEPKQEGSGDPAPDNIRPIAGWDALELTHSVGESQEVANAYIASFGETIYGGRLDWTTGKLLAEWYSDGLQITEKWDCIENGKYLKYTLDNVVYGEYNAVKPESIVCSHYTSGSQVKVVVGGSANKTLRIYDSGFTNLDDWITYMAEQKAAGTPVQVVYKLAEPMEIQLEPHEILALQGVNALYGDGEINISGRSDMQAVVSNLLKRIAALEKR